MPRGSHGVGVGRHSYESITDGSDWYSRPVAPAISDDALAEFADVVMRIARDIDPNGPHAPDIVPLTGTEALVMRWVHHNPGASPSAVAAATALQRSNCSVALRSLVAKGMIERQTAPDDARVVRLRPTAWRTRACRSFTPTGPTACASRSTATTPGSRRLPSCSRASRADCAAVTRRSRLPAEALGGRDPGVTPHYAPDRPTPRHPVASSHQPLRRQVKPCPARSRRQSTRSSAAWRPRTRLRGGTVSSSRPTAQPRSWRCSTAPRCSCGSSARPSTSRWGSRWLPPGRGAAQRVGDPHDRTRRIAERPPTNVSGRA